jgi:hypothetical protein
MPGRDDGKEELERAMAHSREHLESLFIRLDGRETSEELVAMEEAVGRVEVAVESAGGDLMVDEGPKRGAVQPDDPHFVLPQRHAGETVADYLDRLATATDRIRHHRTH